MKKAKALFALVAMVSVIAVSSVAYGAATDTASVTASVTIGDVLDVDPTSGTGTTCDTAGALTMPAISPAPDNSTIYCGFQVDANVNYALYVVGDNTQANGLASADDNIPYVDGQDLTDATYVDQAGYYIAQGGSTLTGTANCIAASDVCDPGSDTYTQAYPSNTEHITDEDFDLGAAATATTGVNPGTYTDNWDLTAEPL